METIRGKTSHDLDINEFRNRIVNHNRILLDLGTGDGRYVHFLADGNPGLFVIGLDACRENLHEYSQMKLSNMLFVIANAQELPRELDGLVSQITINFPWGSLLEGLLTNDPRLLDGLSSIARPGATIEFYLNGGALAEVGTSLEKGAELIHENITQHGWHLDPPGWLDARALKILPTTWAKRLAFGRDPRAVTIGGIRK